MVGSDMAGEARRDEVWPGLVGFGRHGGSRHGVLCIGSVRQAGPVRQGWASFGLVCYGR